MRRFKVLNLILIITIFFLAGEIITNNSSDNFIDQPKVINPASEALSAVFGDSGKHTRAAVSTNSLPLGVAVEVDAIFEIK